MTATLPTYETYAEILARIQYAAAKSPEPIRSYLLVTHAMTRQAMQAT